MFKLIESGPALSFSDAGELIEREGVEEEVWRGDDRGEVLRIFVINGERQGVILGETTKVEKFSPAQAWSRVRGIGKFLLSLEDGIRGPDGCFYGCKRKDVEDALAVAEARALEIENNEAMRAVAQAA